MQQLPVQGPSQSFRDGFSMGGMSQVKQLINTIQNFVFASCAYPLLCFDIYPNDQLVRTSWVMILRVKDHMFHTILLNFQHRYSKQIQWTLYLGFIFCFHANCKGSCILFVFLYSIYYALGSSVQGMVDEMLQIQSFLHCYKLCFTVGTLTFLDSSAKSSFTSIESSFLF